MFYQMIYSILAAATFMLLRISSMKINLQKFEIETNTRIVPTNSSIRTLIAKTFLECASSCTSIAKCYSANHESVTGQCHLYSAHFPHKETSVGENMIKKTGLCNGTMGYNYEANLILSYKAFINRKNHSIAKATCKADGAHLLLISSVQVYNWAVNLMAANDMSHIYFQCERVNKYSPFLDDEGIELIYFNWDEAHPATDIFNVRMERPHLWRQAPVPPAMNIFVRYIRLFSAKVRLF
ncbi:unnamed protein product [Mytilus coruscus]|uniref:Apple domain-containing protein n=1 Tax=Mytilus coruscus TaxID=42192 RepID=A0A6J8BVK3_MYTCO|nr:unnamed protein product [Mytilus coruscus]